MLIADPSVLDRVNITINMFSQNNAQFSKEIWSKEVSSFFFFKPVSRFKYMKLSD